MARFYFFTNHALIFIHIVRRPKITIRELSNIVGISERTTSKIINDLLGEEYITKTREGRNNWYRINLGKSISLPGLESIAAEVLLETLGWKKR
jgi:CTP-dependent riboflavin kinase